jgi:hypothetical protein
MSYATLDRIVTGLLAVIMVKVNYGELEGRENQL